MDGFLANRGRLPIAVLGLLAICLLSTGLSVCRVSKPESAFLSKNGFSELLKDMRPSLPTRGVVGYIDGGNGAPAELQDYYLAQYALAPLVVARSSQEPVVIGNFSRTNAKPPDDLVKIVDLGHGVGLFQNKSTLLAKRSH
jgi:hypothetical protein